MLDQELESFRLLNSNTNYVFDWLKENKPLKNGAYYISDYDEIERKLLERDDPLINLGLALYGHIKETGITLFQNGDNTIKKAVLLGTTFYISLGCSLKDSGILDELIEKWDENLIPYLFKNEYIDDSLLVDLYEKNEPFDSLNNEQWYILLGATGENPRIKTPYNEDYLDGSAEYHYNLVFSSAWKLFEKLPVNKKTASLLGYIGGNLVPAPQHDISVNSTIQRWNVVDPDSSELYGRCRYNIARCISDNRDEFEKLKQSDDIALRQSYYNRFRTIEPETIRKLFIRDGKLFLDEALYNDDLFSLESTAKELSRCCWDCEDDSLMDYPNMYNARLEHLQKEHPAWFIDINDEFDVCLIEDPILRISKQIERLEKKIDDLLA